MTPEQRLDRLERIAKLFVKAGLRARREMRRMDEKIDMMIDAQIKNDERFAQLAEKSAQADEKFALFVEKFGQLAESQARSDRRLDALIDVIRKEHEGDSGRS